MTPPRKPSPPAETGEVLPAPPIAKDQVTAEELAARRRRGIDTTRTQSVGKATKLTDEKFAKVIELVKIGNYATVACVAAGIPVRSYMRYLAKGATVEERVLADYGDDHDFDERSPNPYDETVISEHQWTCFRLRLAMEKAEAEAEAFAVGTVRKHMPDNWNAAMTFLERKAPRRWKRRDLHEVAMAEAGEQDTAQEQGLLDAPASDKLHEALRIAARGELGPGDQAE